VLRSATLHFTQPAQQPPKPLENSTGVETTLSVAIKMGVGAWAAGSAPFMPFLADAVPSFIECVTIAREEDKAGQRGADELGHSLAARGIEAIMLRLAS